MGIRRKLLHKPRDPEDSQHIFRRSGRSATASVPIPSPALVEQRWSSNPTLNARIPRSSTTPVQHRTPPPPYAVIDAGDRLPRHPQPASICSNPPSQLDRSNHRAHDAELSRVPASFPLRRSSASPIASQATRDAHVDATLRRHQSTGALNNAAPHTARRTGPSFIASASAIIVCRTSQLDALRLGR
jgi:hypothetical protein